MADWLLLAASVVLGLAAAAAVWQFVRPVFAGDLFVRENYRGRLVPVGAGIVLAVAAVAAEAVFAVAGAFDVDAVVATTGARLLAVLAAAGYGLLGLIDDIAGAGAERGFAGHVRALSEGRLTTGGLKL